MADCGSCWSSEFPRPARCFEWTLGAPGGCLFASISLSCRMAAPLELISSLESIDEFVNVGLGVFESDPKLCPASERI